MFNMALQKAADQAHAAGTITPEQHTQVSELAQSNSPNQLSAVQHSVQHMLSLSNGPNVSAGINWMQLVAAIQTLMPTIAQIIALLQNQNPTPAPKL